MARYHGGKGRVYISTSGTGNAVSVGNLTEWSLDMGADRAEVTALGDTTKRYVQGPAERRGTIAGYWADNDDTLFSAANSSDGCKIYIYPSSDAPGKYFYGPAWLSITSVAGAVNGAVRIAADFAANGDWGRV